MRWVDGMDSLRLLRHEQAFGQCCLTTGAARDVLDRGVRERVIEAEHVTLLRTEQVEHPNLLIRCHVVHNRHQITDFAAGGVGPDFVVGDSVEHSASS